MIDVGGGSSTLVDGLLDDGYARVTVVDIAAPALEHGRRRLGPAAEQVTWVVSDVTALDLPDTHDVWHDRAVLHFLTDDADRAAYVAVVERHVPVGGHAIIAAFAPDGPDRCSGLPVRQYDAAAMQELFGARWTLVQSLQEDHVTPTGNVQAFTWCVLRRTA